MTSDVTGLSEASEVSDEPTCDETRDMSAFALYTNLLSCSHRISYGAGPKRTTAFLRNACATRMPDASLLTALPVEGMAVVVRS